MSASTRHDVVVGPAGPTRNNVVANLIAADLVSRTVEPWLIDLYDVHRSMIVWPARTLTEARNMLADLNTFRPNDRGQDLCITIEDASVTLQDPQIRSNLAEVLRAIGTASIKFRLAVVNLDLSSFGGSVDIRDAVADGNIIEAVSRG